MVVFRAAFLSFYRSLTRHPLYSALNLLGLSFGIAVFIVLSLYIRFETSYEQWLPNADRIYEIVHRNSPQSPLFYAAPGYVLDTIRENNNNVKATRFFAVYPVVRYADAVREERGQLVDPDFFKLFDLPVLFGDGRAALSAPDGVILSERMARKIFGRADVVGKYLDLRDDLLAKGQQGKEMRWRVMAVIRDVPTNSTLHVDIVRNVAVFRARIGIPYMWYHWGEEQNGRTFLLFPSEDIAKRLAPGILREISQTRINTAVRIDVLPFKTAHLSDSHLVQALWTLRLTAWLAFLVALVNYANLEMARNVLRFREVTVRRVHGALVREILGQALVEALLTGSTSVVVAFSLVEFILPGLNSVGKLSLQIDYARDWLFVGRLWCVVLAGAAAAVLYPASMLTRKKTFQIFWTSKAMEYNISNRHRREGLALIQFSIAGAFLIIIAGFAAQIRHMETSDLGYSRENLLISGALITPPSRSEQVKGVLRQWLALPGIQGVTSGQAPGEYSTAMHATAESELSNGVLVNVDVIATSPGFFKIYGTHVIAGRAIDSGDDAPAAFGSRETVDRWAIRLNANLNIAAVSALGFNSLQAAVGQDVRIGSTIFHIVGVVSNQRFQPPTAKAQPSIFVLISATNITTDAIIRYSGIDEATARRRLETVWRQNVPDLPFDLHSMRQELDYYYRDDRRNTRLFAIGGGVAALIGAVGLFGMAAFNASARVHEIGIRKAQGASRWRIMRLLMFQFLRPVLIANIIAWPIAYVVLDAWLKQFDDRVAMSPLFFLAGSGLSILIAAVTVFGVAWSGANLSPAKALRQL